MPMVSFLITAANEEDHYDACKLGEINQELQKKISSVVGHC